MRAFVLMPFASDFDEIYRDFIADVLDSAGFEVFRADDLLDQRSIIQDIVAGIAQSDLILADLSGNNPNVYYELGLAHAFGKPTILLAQDIGAVPFDLRPYRIVKYGTQFAEMKRAHSVLSKLVNQAVQGQLSFGNPVTDFQVSPVQSRLDRARIEVASDASGLRSLGRVNSETVSPRPKSLSSLSDGINELAGITVKVANDYQRIVDRFVQVGTALKDGEPGSSSVSYRRTLLRELAEELQRFGDGLAEANRPFLPTLDRASNGIEVILRGNLSSSERGDLERFLENSDQIRDSVPGARESLRMMLKNLRSLGGSEDKLDRARDLVVEELETFIENLERTDAMVARAQEVGKLAVGRLEKMKLAGTTS